MTRKEPWFVVDRSQALAGLLLTSRDDLQILSNRKTDIGVDFLVQIREGEMPTNRLFAVQVKGTSSIDRQAWQEEVKEFSEAGPRSIYLPTCLFVTNVRDNRSVYAWMSEPVVDVAGTGLRYPEVGVFQELNRDSLDRIVDRVKAWYVALPRQVQPA